MDFLPPLMGLISLQLLIIFWNDDQGAIMAVGASKPTVVADADGFFSVKNKMLVSPVSISVPKTIPFELNYLLNFRKTYKLGQLISHLLRKTYYYLVLIHLKLLCCGRIAYFIHNFSPCKYNSKKNCKDLSLSQQSTF